MLSIAVCDDEKEIAELVSDNIEKSAQTLGEEISVYTFTDSAGLLELNEKLDLIFLDIEMSDSNGIDIAKKIRQFAPTVQIVFVTNYRNYMKMAYSVHAFDYIEKPVRYEDIHTVLSDYLKLRSSADGKMAVFTSIAGNSILIDTKSILYISCGHVKRTVIVITSDGDYVCKGRINDIFCELDDEDFFMPHRSHIINLSKVKSFVKREKIIMINGDDIPLSKGNSTDFEKRLAERFHERVSVCRS